MWDLSVKNRHGKFSLVVCYVSINSQISCCKQDTRRAIRWILQYERHELKKTNKQFLNKCLVKMFYPTQLKINQRLRMSLKWQRICEWRSTNGDIKATPAGRLQSDLDKNIRYISSCKPPSRKKIRPFFIHYVHLMLYYSVGNFCFY